MKPILVHCHVYYTELWEELKQCIQNITSNPFELFVTMIEKHPDIEKDIKKTFPKAHIEVVDNRGYDIGPFIQILNKVNLDKYSYIIKLHTKRNIRKADICFRRMHSSIWRENLLAPFKSSEIFKKYMDCFKKNPQIGMQANYKLIVRHDIYDNQAQKAMKNWLKEHHLPKIKYAFVAGTMFVVRAHLLKPLQQLNIQISDFSTPVSQKGEHISQLAHVMERLFGYFVYQQDCILYDGTVSDKLQKGYYTKIYLLYFLKAILRLFWQKKVTSSGKLLIKIFKIPVYRTKI